MDSSNVTTLKRCSRGDGCIHPNGPFLPATTQFFYRDRTNRDGLSSPCRLCARKHSNRKQEVVPEGFKRCSKGANCLSERGPILPATTEYFYRAKYGLGGPCKVCQTAQAKEWRAKHPELIREMARKHYYKDPSKQKAINARRLREHPEYFRMRDAQRSAKRRALPATFTARDWKYAVGYFRGVCAYCGKGPRLFDINWVLHQEHYIPESKGGGYTADNILPACQDCNYSKGDQDVHEWLVSHFGKHQARIIEKRIREYFKTIET